MHMKHLGPDELIDLAEGVRAEGDAPHLASCGACRGQLAELRAALLTLSGVSAAEAADVPEPSPLFWDHFSARVREAVAAEGSPRRHGRWGLFSAWSRPRWLGPVPLAGACAMIAVAVALTSYFLAPGVPEPPASGIESAMDGATLPVLGAADDPTLSLVADLTADLDLDGAGEAGLTASAHVGGADDVVSMLTEDERRELQRLLKEELAKPHA
jgi:hypothetical protein